MELCQAQSWPQAAALAWGGRHRLAQAGTGGHRLPLFGTCPERTWEFIAARGSGEMAELLGLGDKGPGRQLGIGRLGAGLPQGLRAEDPSLLRANQQMKDALHAVLPLGY